MKKANHIYSVITTKSPEEWETLKHDIQMIFAIDIIDFVPIYLTLNDFKVEHDPDFKPWGIISSWWQYKKLPIILITDEQEIPL